MSLTLMFLAIGSLIAMGADLGAPQYTADSIVNPIAGVAGKYAPNSFITIYGKQLSYVTKAMGPDDLGGGILPTTLLNTNVRVSINHIPADIYYVSPTQVNLLVPASLTAGPSTIQLNNDGLVGPAISIMLDSVAPAVFELTGTTVLAAHLDGSVVSSDAPAHRGEVVVLYATGLGVTIPPVIPNSLPTGPASIARLPDFQVLLNGLPVTASRILYAGISPPYAGLFQINLRIPDDAPTDPEIRCGFPESLSQAGGILPIR